MWPRIVRIVRLQGYLVMDFRHIVPTDIILLYKLSQPSADLTSALR